MAITTITPIDVFTELARKWDFFIRLYTSDAWGTNYVTNNAAYGNSGDDENDHIDRYIYRHLTTGTDRVKKASTMNTTTAQLSIDSNTAYVSTGAGTAYFECAMHPDDMFAALMDAMRDIPESKTVPLGLGHDYDMELSGTDYWGGGSALGSSSKSNITLTKDTSDDRVNWGEQSLHGALTVAGGYTRGEKVRVTPGGIYYFAPDVLVEAGAVIPRIWDFDNGAYIETANESTYNGGEWAVLERTFTAPAGCYRVQPQLQGTIISTVFNCDGYFGPYYPLTRNWARLPVWANESYKPRLVRAAKFLAPIAGVAGAKAADSRVWTGDMERGTDFDVEIERRAANPNQLNFRETENVRDIMGKEPLFLMGERTAADAEPMSSEGLTTTQPLDLVVAYFMHRIALKALELKPNNKAWERRAAETKMTEALELVPRSISVASAPVKITHTRLVRA